MKKTTYISFLITLLCSMIIFAQEPERNDDLGDVSDAFQSNFYEAIKQKGIENYDKAIDLLVNCKLQNPNSAAVYFELGKNYFELEKYQLAENAFQKANSLKPNNEWILVALYKLQRSRNNQSKITEALEKLAPLKAKYKETLSNQYYVTKQYKKALQTIDELNTKEGISEKREKLRYQIYSRQKKLPEIVRYIENKIAQHTVQPYDFTQLIYTHSVLKNNTKAFEAAKLFKTTFPKSNKPYVSLYKYYITQGKTEKAVNAMHRVLENGSTVSTSEKYKVLNDFFLFTKKNTQYLPELEKALKSYPNKSISTQLIGLYDATQNTDKSEAVLQDAIKNTSTNFNDLKKLTELLLAKNKYQNALKTSTKALDLYPAQPILYLQKGKALIGLKKAKKAIAILELGLDYIIDEPQMKQNFYTRFTKAYQILGDTKNQKKYLAKIKK